VKFSCHPPAAAAPSALPAADFWPGEFQGLMDVGIILKNGENAGK